MVKILLNQLGKQDYILLLSLSGEQNIAPQVGGAKKDNRGGHNKEIFIMNINTFKKFCLKAQTKKLTKFMTII